MERIKDMPQAGFGPCTAIGVINGRNEPLAGVVYHDYQPEFSTMQVSMAAISPRWAMRGIIRELLSYPFDQVQVNKLWAALPHTNERAIRFIRGLGFTQEAVLGRHFGKTHAVICRLYKEDYYGKKVNSISSPRS